MIVQGFAALGVIFLASILWTFARAFYYGLRRECPGCPGCMCEGSLPGSEHHGA